MYCRDICRRRGCDDEETTLTDEETRDVGVLVEVVMNGWTFDEHQLDWVREREAADELDACRCMEEHCQCG